MSGRRTLRVAEESSSSDDEVILRDVSLPQQDGKTPGMRFRH